jgi:hypothetical protein
MKEMCAVYDEYGCQCGVRPVERGTQDDELGRLVAAGFHRRDKKENVKNLRDAIQLLTCPKLSVN